MMAMTVDGKIAKTADHFPDWTSKEDKKLFAKIIFITNRQFT